MKTDLKYFLNYLLSCLTEAPAHALVPQWVLPEAQCGTTVSLVGYVKQAKIFVYAFIRSTAVLAVHFLLGTYTTTSINTITTNSTTDIILDTFVNISIW